jgi:uncharacterized damage-inducible protein DinB
MTKSYFIELVDYNIWANDIVHSWFEKISDEQWKRPVISSFNSLEATSLHVLSAERVWLDRLNKAAAPVWLQDSFKGSKKEILNEWRKTSGGLKSFVENFDESCMQTNLAFKRLNGEAYDMPHYEIFAHVFNHGSYHRGQMVTILRQIGFTGVSSTDLLGFFRNKN